VNPFDREDSQHETAGYTAKAPAGRTAKGKGGGKAIPVAAELPPQQAEERQRQMRALIQLGKEQGYLTHAQINDHLPDNFAQTAAIDSIVSAFNDMGVAVYEQAPDAETLLLNSNAPAVVSDDQADEETEVALSTVDSEFGRTTDPVRMYMREMGATELLTRAGEIAIAKRIEDGLHEMVQAIAACPLAISAILASAQQVADGELRIDELVDGLNEDTVAAEEANASADAAADVDTDATDDDDSDSEDDDDAGPADSSAADEARLKQRTNDCLALFADRHRGDRFAAAQTSERDQSSDGRG
jgi:RNA polymerase primary sigma factor